MNRHRVLGLFAVLATSACTGTGTTISVPLPATAILVDPAEFLGDVPCFPQFDDASPAPAGAMRRYVATLVSVHAGGILDAAQVPLPSSPPTRCSDPVSFQRVVDGTAYVAEIDGYDVEAIRPLGGGTVFGSRVMVDQRGEFVPPRWQTSCGLPKAMPHAPRDAGPDRALTDSGDAGTPSGTHDARAPTLDTGVPPYGRCTGHALQPGEVPENLEGPVCAVANVSIPMQGCEPLREVNPPKVRTTAITVDLNDLVSTKTPPDQCLTCGNGPGDVAAFRVELDGSSEPARTAPCGTAVTFEIPAGKLATFTVTAYGSGTVPGANACEVDGGTGEAGAPANPSDASAPVVDGGTCGPERQIGNGNRGVWCTRCFGQSLPGVTLRATCDPLGVTQRRPY